MKDNDIFAEDKKKLNKAMSVYGVFNGVCVVGALRQCAHMVKDGYDTFRQSVTIQSSTASLHAILD